MKTKEEVIKEAYEENYPIVKNYLNDDGICEVSLNSLNIKAENIEYFDSVDRWRPISLKGIETNNNWISIQSEKDLPKTRGDFYVFLLGTNKEIVCGCTKLLKSKEVRSYWVATTTHYQPIVKPQPPLHK